MYTNYPVHNLFKINNIIRFNTSALPYADESMNQFFTNAGDRNRTDTVFPQQDFKSCASASSATPAQWMEVDSNHRSNMQQIYSLSPLANRESIHFLFSHRQCIPALTMTNYITRLFFTQAVF